MAGNSIIKNVLVCEKDNLLKPVDIIFNKSVKKVIPLSERLVNWKEIDSPEKKNRFIKTFFADRIHTTENSINGNFNLLIPGAVDAHVHFDTPGFEFRDDFEHGSTAAAFGGTTTVIDMPCTSLPPVTSIKAFKEKLSVVKNRSVVDFAFWGGVRGNDFENPEKLKHQIIELAKNGVAAFKAYFTSGMETFTDLTFEQMLFAAKVIESTGKILAVHAEDKDSINKSISKNINPGIWQSYCKARSVNAEVIAVKNMIRIAELTGCRIHIVHLSSGRALKLIKEAQNSGVKITAETCPHYLYFTQNDFENKEISAFLKTAPPVKFPADKKALWKGLAEGTLSFVTTDHAGSRLKEKASSDFSKVYGGIPGVEHRVEFLFSEGFLKKQLTLEQTINALSHNPAQLFGLKNKGSFAPGFDADFAVVDLWKQFKVKSSAVHAKGKYTPFNNLTFNSFIELTILGGNVVSNRKEKYIAKPGLGKFIKIL